MTSRYIFRIDDVCPTQDRSRWSRLRDLFLNRKVSPIIGVIPECKDPRLAISPLDEGFWKEIRDLQSETWTIAQHGYQHLYETSLGGILNINQRSEFAGLSYEKQKQKISIGKKKLESEELRPALFVAPAHSFDINTLRALVDCGYQIISDGISLFPFWKGKMLWIPQLWWDPTPMPSGIHTICLHPQIIDIDRLDRIEKFINQQGSRIVNFDWVLDWADSQSQVMKVYYSLLADLFNPIWKTHQVIHSRK
jgi:predicted deacetylase